MLERLTSRRVLMLAVTAWLIAAGPAIAKDNQLPPTDAETPWGPGCSPDYQKWCHDNVKNYSGQTCRNLKIYIRADGKCQCDCLDKPGETIPGKKKGPG